MERRSAERIKAALPVVCRVRGSLSYGLTYDISTDGCMLQACDGLVSSGEDVQLSFADLTNVAATVVWTKHRNAGVRFNTPLPQSAIAQLVSRSEEVPDQRSREHAGSTLQEAQRSRLGLLGFRSAVAAAVPRKTSFAISYTACVLALVCIELFALTS